MNWSLNLRLAEKRGLILPVQINVASQPFQRERARTALLAAICGALTCSLLVLIGLFLHVRAQAGQLRNVINGQRTQLQILQRQQNGYSSVLGRPENADVFSTSVFLNQLIARRAVSWTGVFRDLSKIMPNNVRLEGIRLPQLAEEDAVRGANHVELDMIVGTDSPDAVIEFLKRLQQSDLFGAAQAISQTPPTQNDPLYKFRIMVAYAQKL